MRDRLLKSKLSDNCIDFVRSNLLATSQGTKPMNFATALQFDSISLPTWADNFINSTRKAAVYSSIVIKAFSKTLAPVIFTTTKDLSMCYVQCLHGLNHWTMRRVGITHNPVTAAVKAAYAELVSPASLTTYRRIRHIIREAAMTALVVGLCGVVAISVGIELAQAGYRAAAGLYEKVYARFNSSEPQPELLPSCEMATASTELAAALDNFAEVAEADSKAKAEDAAEVQYCLESMMQSTIQLEAMPDYWTEPLPLFHTPSVVGQVWNPAPGPDMHQQVAELYKLQYVPFTLSPAPEPVAQSVQKPQPEQKPARAPRNRVKVQPQPEASGKRKPDRTKTGVK
jgi:hypothetical protein